MTIDHPTIPELLKHAALHWPTRDYLRQREGAQVTAITYRMVYESVSQWAAVLTAHDIRPGHHVALWGENSPDWVCAFFAILHCGAVVVPFDPQLAPPEVESLCAFAAVKLIVMSPTLSERWTAVSFRRNIIQFATLRSEAAATESIEPRRREPADVAMLIFTSGTTGEPKGVILTHQNLVSDALGVIATIEISANENFLLLLPLFHTYSLTVNLLCSLAGGACATFATSYKSRDIIDDIRIAKVTLLIGVPQIYENIMQSFQRALASQSAFKRRLVNTIMGLSRSLRRFGFNPAVALLKRVRHGAGFESMRLLVSGGAALRPEINHYFADLGFDLVQGYGLTETSPVLSCNPPQKNRIGSVGPPVRGAEYRIDKPDAQGIGEICARGPMVMQGYYENEKASTQVLREGWFHTGDAGFLDRAGYLHITGRIKNIIVTSAGKNIYPEEIEALLNLSPFVLESLVQTAQNPKSGAEELVARLYPDPTTVASAHESGNEIDLNSELRQVVDKYNKTAPPYRQIRRWKIQEQEFAKTSTRKIRRFQYKDFSA